MCVPDASPRKRKKHLAGRETPCSAGIYADIVGAMAHIPYVPYDRASGLLAELYRRYGGSGGSIDNIVRIHSLNPPSMAHHMQLYAHLMRGPSPLSRVQREMLAVTVSAINDCFY